jgi:type I restriction enzyme S subunit
MVEISPEFAGFYFRSPRFRAFVTSMASITTRASLNNEMLAALSIVLPPFPEQQAIAGVLSSLDDKIDLLHRQNKTLEGMAEALWRKMFVEEADPGWEKGRLGDIARNIRENVTVEDLENHDNYVGLEHIERKHLALYEWGHAADLGSNKARFRKRDILFGKLRAYFHKVCFAPIDGVCSTDILVIRPLIPEYHALCLLWFFSEDVVNYSDASSGGTRMPRTNWETLAGYEILIPGKDHINRFSAYVKPMIDRIEMNILSIRTLSRLRDTLLPKLMSGEVVVKA